MSDSIYSSLIVDSSRPYYILKDGTLMIKILKTLKSNSVVYLSYSDSSLEYDKVTSALRIIEYYVMAEHSKLYRNTFNIVNKLDNKDIINVFNAIGPNKEISILKNKNYLLKRLSILLADEILMQYKIA